MSEIKSEIAGKVLQLEEKYKNSGQDLGSYLDGLLYDKYLTYWDYINLDTLLSLQKPRTHFPDEEIFITYHQITELYFKLVIHEQKQILDSKDLSVEIFTEKINRMIRYFRILTNSFDVMIKGMDREQFLKFRMALLPASGFQSAQFRMIELYATPLKNLVHNEVREKLKKECLEEMYNNIYWKRGATNLDTGEKTLTLKQFEKEYTPRFLSIARQYEGRTIWNRYNLLPAEDQNNKHLIEALRNLDVSVNVNWLLIHIGAAQRYLVNKNKTVAPATGGTNWKEFLPPSFQRITFFPDLWKEEEMKNWGKEWVDRTFNNK